MTGRLGLLVAGSVAEGLSARLDPTVPIEDVRLGKFVKIVGQKYEYFCLVTDVQLDSANTDVLRDPPGDPNQIDSFLRQVLKKPNSVGSCMYLGSSSSSRFSSARSTNPLRTLPLSSRCGQVGISASM